MTRNRRVFLFSGSVLLIIIALAFFPFKKQSPLLKQLNNISAQEALALANTWRQEGRNIKTFVNSENIVFELPDGRTKKIALPSAQTWIVALLPSGCLGTRKSSSP